MSDLHITVHHAPGALAVLTAAGEIDFTTAPQLRERGMSELRHHAHLVIDMAGVGFCDSAGLSALIGLWHGAQGGGGSLMLAAIPDRLGRLMRMTGVGDLIPAHADATDAVAAHLPAADAM